MNTPTEDAAKIAGPAPSGVGLLVIDMINDLDFPGAEPLIAACEAVADRIVGLRAEADRLGVPTIYVNDNFGHWRAERSAIIEHVMRRGSPGREIVKRLAPRSRDFFVIKPRFSGFYATNLQVLLPQLGVDRLVLTGVATDICVLFTAADAYMREYGVWTPHDAVASDDPQRATWALEMMRNSMGARTDATGDLTLEDWIGD
ncbi:isochorismatase family cysteine hydrolase [Caulobacter sp.]|uniref:isochorismatase family cysteine hydrolase n=1 Tax=Caulobacter sp. TaxID=78 RepID=UPI002B48DBFF|nr:isochorismatase family cysteine hydrolase [Caulobacter sp.]HJV40534.1 isochorismatase family cysteine hydrolase [Caulobacter sp.]